jgi:aspartyl protease family protein
MCRHLISFMLLLSSFVASAADFALIGVIGGKAAVLAVDGGEPKTVKVGQTWNGLTVLAVEHDRAIVDHQGKTRVLQLGAHHRGTRPAATTRPSVTLASDGRGHFFADGTANGVALRFIVDTGATMIVLSAEEAKRMGLDYRSAPRGSVQTANGVVPAYLVRLDLVKVGAIELSNVEALVVEQNTGVALLGMSFLNRLEMRRDGDSMTLIRRF